MIGPVYVRWLDVRRDFPKVYAIERNCFEYPWTADEFQRCLATRNVIGKVAEVPNGDGSPLIVGYLVYEIHQTWLHVLNIGVHPWFRRINIGTRLIGELVSRPQIRLSIRERNLGGQLFFRSLGFRATAITYQPYEETDEDAYVMYRGRVGRCRVAV